MKRLGRGDDPAQVLEALSVQLTNKLLHPPTVALNQTRGGECEQLIDTLSRLYDLHAE